MGTAADIATGAQLFDQHCGSCHANFVPSPVPDLRRSALIRDAASFASVVRGGALEKQGMPSWDDLLSADDVEKIRADMISVAREAYAEQQKGCVCAGGAAGSEGRPPVAFDAWGGGRIHCGSSTV